MTNLECNVVSCGNNRDNCCCRPNIQVNGPCASNAEQTKCSSFFNAAGTANASVGCNVPNDSLEILCSAENCTFNSGEQCHADHISVRSETASADDESKTECASFRFR